MTPQDILNKAKYILFPGRNTKYVDYSDTGFDIVLLPIITGKQVLYTNSINDLHHYTTEYHIKHVMPILANILNFNYDENDFVLKKHIVIDKSKNVNMDMSYLIPKEKCSFDITLVNTNTTYKNLPYDRGLVFNKDLCDMNLYRSLYVFPHKCSIIRNNLSNSNRKLFVSGDSQMIGCISMLAYYFKEVWYFDNRTGMNRDWKVIDKDKTTSFLHFYKDILFTDILIELYTNPIWWYTDINLF